MHHFVDESHLEGSSRSDRSPGQDHIERRLKPDTSWKALRAAHSRNESELNLRRRECRRWVIGADAIGRRKRDLETSTQAGTVNRRDDRNAQCLQAVENLL